ncbi:FkbM family methyltransferase [Metallosphaera sp. D4-4]|uniref:FkbM family methyltransferase n=1 Tax=Metallosphaera sp. D4-4 TaxID=3379815 RepID=UPI003908B3FD
MIFKYGNLEIEIPQGYEYVYYATFILGEYDFLHVRKDDVVLDAGAFVGDYTLKIAKHVKEVIAVEPIPSAFEILKSNIERNNLKNIMLVNKALYDSKAVVTMKNEGVGSSVGEGEIKVETVSIDELVNEVGGKITVMKMDIEGAEGKAIYGDYIKSVREIGIELHGEDNIKAVSQYLKQNSYKLIEMSYRHVLFNTVKNIITHFPSFIKAETKTKVFASTIFSRKYNVPALSNNQIKVVYARRTMNILS